MVSHDCSFQSKRLHRWLLLSKERILFRGIMILSVNTARVSQKSDLKRGFVKLSVFSGFLWISNNKQKFVRCV